MNWKCVKSGQENLFGDYFNDQNENRSRAKHSNNNIVGENEYESDLNI